MKLTGDKGSYNPTDYDVNILLLFTFQYSPRSHYSTYHQLSSTGIAQSIPRVIDSAADSKEVINVALPQDNSKVPAM